MKTVFIANRGEIALRILRTARSLGYRVAVARPDVDSDLPYAVEADVVVPLASPGDFAQIEPMVKAALLCEADLLHPGYGFLSESGEFARAIRAAGIGFVGPTADAIEALGNKGRAREIAMSCGVPIVQGSLEPLVTYEAVYLAAEQIGFPIMLKAVAGGGGIGMEIAGTESVLEDVFQRVSSRATSMFGDPRLIVERYVARSKHIEVQVMGLPDGEIIALAERDCSVQRRHQKIVEESPSLALDTTTREDMSKAAVRLAEAVRYLGAGTVEFIYDLDRNEFYFLEMNTRLQVEHPITEAVYGIDLVAWQLAIAEGSDAKPIEAGRPPTGHSIELRVYAEDSERFLPRPGRITKWVMPDGEGIRVDAGYTVGNDVTPLFDPMIAKIVVSAATRGDAIGRALDALAATRIEGPGTNLAFLERVLRSPRFEAGDYTAGTLVG